MSGGDTRSTRTEPRCALGRSSRATELFVALTSHELSFLLTEWVRGRNEEERPGATTGGRGDRERRRRARERERESDSEELRACVGGKRRVAQAVVTRCNRYCDIFDRTPYFFPVVP